MKTFAQLNCGTFNCFRSFIRIQWVDKLVGLCWMDCMKMYLIVAPSHFMNSFPGRLRLLSFTRFDSNHVMQGFSAGWMRSLKSDDRKRKWFRGDSWFTEKQKTYGWVELLIYKADWLWGSKNIILSIPYYTQINVKGLYFCLSIWRKVIFFLVYHVYTQDIESNNIHNFIFIVIMAEWMDANPP